MFNAKPLAEPMVTQFSDFSLKFLQVIIMTIVSHIQIRYIVFYL